MDTEPWCRPNHGIQTAYEFGEDIGGMERSRYFGYSKDLYHFDHFLGEAEIPPPPYSFRLLMHDVFGEPPIELWHSRVFLFA